MGYFVFRGLLLVTLLHTVFAAQPSEQGTVIAKALAYRVIPHQRTTYFRTPGYSNTTCYGNGTYLGNSVSAVANCSTVSTPPETQPVSIVSVEVFNQLDIGGLVYTTRCTARWVGSNCSSLNPGDDFPAEIKGTTLWVTSHKGGNMGKEIHSKFQILDVRPLLRTTPEGVNAKIAVDTDSPRKPALSVAAAQPGPAPVVPPEAPAQTFAAIPPPAPAAPLAQIPPSAPVAPQPQARTRGPRVRPGHGGGLYPRRRVASMQRATTFRPLPDTSNSSPRLFSRSRRLPRALPVSLPRNPRPRSSSATRL